MNSVTVADILIMHKVCTYFSIYIISLYMQYMYKKVFHNVISQLYIELYKVIELYRFTKYHADRMKSVYNTVTE